LKIIISGGLLSGIDRQQEQILARSGKFIKGKTGKNVSYQEVSGLAEKQGNRQ
jgi:hypothetical protein